MLSAYGYLNLYKISSFDTLFVTSPRRFYRVLHQSFRTLPSTLLEGYRSGRTVPSNAQCPPTRLCDPNYDPSAGTAFRSDGNNRLMLPKQQSLRGRCSVFKREHKILGAYGRADLPDPPPPIRKCWKRKCWKRRVAFSQNEDAATEWVGQVRLGFPLVKNPDAT